MSNVATIQDDSLEGVGNPFASRFNESSFLPKDAVIRMFAGNISDPYDRSMAEELLTKSLRCQGYLKEPGDLAVFERTGTFDKSGDYHIYLYYAILPEKKKEAEKSKAADGEKSGEAKESNAE